MVESKAIWNYLTSSGTESEIFPTQIMKNFLEKIFSKDVKRKIFEMKMKSTEDILKSVKEYFFIGNLIISIKFLTEWEKEALKVIQQLRNRPDSKNSTKEPCLTQIKKLCQRKRFFEFLGYGPLIKNINVLMFFMNIQKNSKNAASFNKEFHENLTVVEPQFNETILVQVLYTQELLKKLFFLSSFSKSFSSKLRTVILFHLKNYHESTDLKLKLPTLIKNLFYDIEKLPAVQSFLQKYKSSDSQEKFISDWIYPPLPESTSQEVSDLSQKFVTRICLH